MNVIFKFLPAFLLLGFTAKAQVGINTQNPDTTAILHIYSNNKGVLLPVLDSNARRGLSVVATDGLLVYDSASKTYYFVNRKEDAKWRWYALNPFQTTEEDDAGGNKDDVKLGDPFKDRNVVIGSGYAGLDMKLHVKGNIKSENTLYSTKAVIDDSVKAKTLNVSDEIRGSSLSITNTINTQNVYASNNILGKKIEVSTLNAEKASIDTVHTNFVTGSVPKGGIIMWSGNISDIPNGWRLCDGGNEENITIPDLRGQFIVGYDPDKTDYSSIGKTGGVENVQLTTAQMPSHNHPVSNYTRVTGGGTKTGDKDWLEAPGGTSVNSGNAGSGEAHENRPPYYVLAFIIRVK